MRRSCCFLNLSLLSLLPFSISSTCASARDEATFYLAGGLRTGHFRTGVGSFHHSPFQFESHLSWAEVQAYEVLAGVNYVNRDNIYFRGYADYGGVRHGRFKDSDFIKVRCGDDIEVSDARADTPSGELFDLSGGIGYNFGFLSGRINVSPLFGYSYHVQNFNMKNLFLRRDILNQDEGAIAGMNSSYKARWTSPWLGVDFTFRMTRCWSLIGGGEYHWARYRAKGHWNLHRDLSHPFRQTAWGYGQLYRLGLNGSFVFAERRWSCGILGIYERWKTQSGRNKTFIRGFDEPLRSKMLPVHWYSWSWMVNIQYYY